MEKTYSDYWKLLFYRDSKEIQQLNGIRAISMLIIILCHIWVVGVVIFSDSLKNSYLGHFMENLVSGVDLFFLLSGFLIYKILYTEYSASREIDFKRFYTKRGFRIFPIYYFFLTITFFVARLTVFAIEKKSPLSVSDSILAYLIRENTNIIRFDFLYLSDFFESFHPHTWSLSVEEQFYLIFPFLAIFLLRFDRTKRIYLLLFAYFLPMLIRLILYFQIIQSSNLFFAKSIFTRFDSIIVGIILFETYSIFIEDNKKVIPYRNIILPSSFLLLFLIHTLSYGDNIFSKVFYLNTLHIGFYLIVYFSLTTVSNWSKFLNLRIWVPLAKLSYSMYIWHILVFGAIFGKTINSAKGMDNLYWYVFSHSMKGFFLTLFISLLSYSLIEVPFF